MSKEKIRAAIKLKLKGLTAAERREGSARLAARVFDLSAWRESDLVLSFVGLPEEVDTGPLITAALKLKKRVFIPRIDGRELVFHEINSLADASVPHPYGMLEPDPGLPVLPSPLPASGRVLILVPGLAFDRRQNRLGRGRGYYDRFLGGLSQATARHRCFFLGVCFHRQLLESVPVSPHDIPMDAVATEDEAAE